MNTILMHTMINIPEQKFRTFSGQFRSKMKEIQTH